MMKIIFACPNCLNKKGCDNLNAMLAGNITPHNRFGLVCLSCGLTAAMELNTGEYLSLDALNDLRLEKGHKPLATLPKQDKTLNIKVVESVDPRQQVEQLSDILKRWNNIFEDQDDPDNFITTDVDLIIDFESFAARETLMNLRVDTFKALNKKKLKRKE